ncbi:hypothetical protein ACIBL3_05440 [Kribbella sp. NPDC050124]|uniref:hypothetical protein n=1 Tax=Kribbella sp. NPDC050124 TaxID=3364114 RepID=UPI0037A13E19
MTRLLATVPGVVAAWAAQGYAVMSGHVVIGSALHRLTYPVFDGTDRPYDVILDRIGGGRDPFVALSSSQQVASDPAASTGRLYALRPRLERGLAPTTPC